jgi:hypothetical protein
MIFFPFVILMYLEKGPRVRYHFDVSISRVPIENLYSVF